MTLKTKKIKKELISSAIGAVVSVGIFNHNPISATFATSLDFKFFNLLKNVLFQFLSPSFFDSEKHL